MTRKLSLITSTRPYTILFKIPSYDSDKSGAIDKKEMTRVMKSIYAMLGTKGTDRSSLDEKVCYVFQNLNNLIAQTKTVITSN